MASALETQEQEFATYFRSVSQSVDLTYLGEDELRAAAGITHNRPLLEFHQNGQLSNQNQLKTRSHRNFLRLLLNIFFNTGEPGEVRYPPLALPDDPKAQPAGNLLWRKGLETVLYYVDPKAPDTRDVPLSRRLTYRKLVTRACALDPVFFVAGFCWGIDPRSVNPENTIRPFIPWPRQQDAIRAIAHAVDSEEPSENVVIVKGRDVGMTFIPVNELLRRWLFLDESAMVVTLKESLLDSKKPDSAFGKIRFNLYRLPAWMLPDGWSKNRFIGCDKDASLTKPMWVPDATNAAGGRYVAEGPAIDGFACTGDAATGRRYKTLLVDEHGAIGAERPGGEDAKIYLHAADSVKCRISTGTPRGRSTFHSELARKARAQQGDEVGPDEIKLVYLHINWKDDPRKNRPLFCMRVRPAQYSTQEEYYGILLRLYYLAASGRTGTDEYHRLMNLCMPLDPVRDEVELAREMSPWYLAKCKDLAGSEEGADAILTEVDGVEADDLTYFFSEAVLGRMPLALPDEAGGFREIETNARMASFDPSMPGQMYVWSRPRAGRFYGMTSDSGMGQGADYSVISVWDVTHWPVTQVAMFRCARTGPEELALYVLAIHRWYNGAYWCMEANAEGRSTITRAVLEFRFPRNRIYANRPPSLDRPSDLQWCGWRSTGEMRHTLFVSFREEFESVSSPIAIRSDVMAAEIGALTRIPAQKTGGSDKIVSDGKMHDDCAIAAALVVPMLKGYNLALFGREVFDVVGARKGLQTQRDEERRRERERASRIRNQKRDADIPIWAGAA